MPPLGPSSSEYPGCSPKQASACRHGRLDRASCRRRVCLLKGCERPFQPRHPLSRYCSEACRGAARRWSQWRANQRYRASEQGRSRRREQSRLWRRRAAERRSQGLAGETPSEGYQEDAAAEEFCCSRSGCYERFNRSRRSPLRKFCSFLCRRALGRVLQRESRWRRRWTAPRQTGCGLWNRPGP